MIQTLRPYGAIKESEILFLVENPCLEKYILVDNKFNQFQISKDQFMILKNKGLKVREVRFKV